VAIAEPAAPATRERNPPYPWLGPGIYVGASAPLSVILWRAANGLLSANPIAEVMNQLGLAALILLVACLACTPARHVFGWTWPARIRRDLGLLAFYYAVLHVLVYLLLDQLLAVGAIVADIAERPFITVGFLAFVTMIPLALTSTKRSIRRMGFARWNRLHHLVYLAGALAIVHFIWRVKADLTQPLIYGGVLLALFGVRLLWWLWRRSTRGYRTGR